MSPRLRLLLARRVGPWVPLVSAGTLRADAIAGLLGAILVLPQGIAFAMLAGLPPEYGLYSAIVPCAVAALFGSSWHVVSGPTNANSLALFAMLTPLAVAGSAGYIELALAVTVLVGVMQWLVGVTRLGSLASFISPAALLGFIGGAALLIVVHALPNLLAVVPGQVHGGPAAIVHLAQNLGTLQPSALLVGAATIAAVLITRRVAPRWPAMLIGVAVGTALSSTINAWPGTLGLAPVATVGAFPGAWPPFRVPQVNLAVLPDLLGIAVALTIVALAQSISIAKVMAARSGQRLDANREFIGQGVSNMVGGFFSCYVSCGSLNRSMPNLDAGARTPLASVLAAGWLLMLAAAAAPLLALIPMPAIAGLLIVVAWSLLDAARWRRLWQLGRTDLAVAGVTLVTTVTIRMEVAILIGTVASLGSYLYRTSRPAMRRMGFDTMAPERPFVVIDDNPNALPECRKLQLLRMEGSVYFGATPHVADRLHALRLAHDAPRHLLVMAKSMNFLDLAGAELWHDEMRARRAMGGDLYFHRPRPQVMELWERSGFLDELGRDHIFTDKHTAIRTILARVAEDDDPCTGCGRRVFHECTRHSLVP